MFHISTIHFRGGVKLDIINYREIDKLEEHLKNRTIQEALLREDSMDWALNYDKENLGKNFAIAYGLNVSEWEQYKSLQDFEKIDSSVSGEGNAFVILGRSSLRFADLFYDRILPYATKKTIAIYGYDTHKLSTGTNTLLKYDFSSGNGRHGYLTLGTYLDGDKNITNIADGKQATKCITKVKDLSITRYNCSCNYSYTVWYI